LRRVAQIQKLAGAGASEVVLAQEAAPMQSAEDLLAAVVADAGYIIIVLLANFHQALQ
jgi:hypothetical protein